VLSVPSVVNVFYALNLRRRREFVTTETELKAIAVEARMGWSSRPVKG
jgi:hypothetical protein